jgi:hypothetical protein
MLKNILNGFAAARCGTPLYRRNALQALLLLHNLEWFFERK